MAGRWPGILTIHSLLPCATPIRRPERLLRSADEVVGKRKVAIFTERIV